MMESKFFYNRPRNRAIFAVSIVCIFALLLSGCAVGYITFHPQEGSVEQTAPKLGHLKIFYSIASTDSLLAMSFERTLRSRFHILDLQRLKSNEDKDADGFLIRVEHKFKTSTGDLIPFIISFLSFSILPAVGDDHQLVVFTVRSPAGEEKTFQYGYTERLYSWLPFLLFGPRIVGGINGGYDDYGEERRIMLDDITTRFMVEAAPFMLDRSSALASRGSSYE